MTKKQTERLPRFYHNDSDPLRLMTLGELAGMMGMTDQEVKMEHIKTVGELVSILQTQDPAQPIRILDESDGQNKLLVISCVTDQFPEEWADDDSAPTGEFTAINCVP
jgi:hypothetical protein